MRLAHIDHILKLYVETIQSPYLHYGYWDDPDQVEVSEIGLKGIVEAQERYIVNLASFIPDTVTTILDAGCGIGGNTVFLTELGFEVEALSPDLYQKHVFEEKLDGAIPFHHSKFETFGTDKWYDLVLMSESAAYINMRSGIEKAYELLRSNGYWLVSDYFVVSSTDSDSPHLKSAHHLKTYLVEARNAGFTSLKEVDITENVMPTLDVANYFYHKFLKPVAEYATVSLERKHPKMLSLLRWLYGKKVDKKMRQLDYLRSDEFRKYRKYMILLFQKLE